MEMSENVTTATKRPVWNAGRSVGAACFGKSRTAILVSPGQ
jgi:hypothetical protein